MGNGWKLRVKCFGRKIQKYIPRKSNHRNGRSIKLCLTCIYANGSWHSQWNGSVADRRTGVRGPQGVRESAEKSAREKWAGRPSRQFAHLLSVQSLEIGSRSSDCPTFCGSFYVYSALGITPKNYRDLLEAQMESLISRDIFNAPKNLKNNCFYIS